MSWLKTIEHRRAGNDPNFIGDGESLEHFASRRPKPAGKVQVPLADAAEYAAFVAAREAHSAAQAAPATPAVPFDQEEGAVAGA